MWNYLGPALLCLLITAATVIFDLHAKAVFLAVGYTRVHHHGKTFKRAVHHYKTNWSFFQRILWMPVFAEAYAPKYRTLAILSYLHYAIAVVVLALYAATDLIGAISDRYWILCFAFVFVPFTIGKFIYTNALARSKL